MKRVKKRYLDDPSISIPKRTLYRHSAKKQLHVEVVNQYDSEPCMQGIAVVESCQKVQVTEKMWDEIIDSQFEYTNTPTSCSDVNKDYIVENDTLNSNNSSYIELEEQHLTDESDTFTDNSSESSDYETESSDNSTDDCPSDIEVDKKEETFSLQQIQAMCFLSYTTRHHLTGAAGNDLLHFLCVFFPDRTVLQGSYNDILQSISYSKFKCLHYCSVCSGVFPEDEDIYKCPTDGCAGLRYEGKEQLLPSRRPFCKFLIADIEKQLVTLFSNSSLFNDIKKTKEHIQSTSQEYLRGENFIIQDITDGKCYRELCQEGQFLADQNAISGIFNTDGVPLYSSTKEKLWPIFIAVNEIGISRRFHRENMILAGIWQGKKNPPFFHYLSAFGEAISELYFDGFNCQGVVMKFGVFLGTVDLQAKGYVANMTMHNGLNGCVTCEEPGQSVRSGGGHSRQYPYRKNEEKFPMRNSDDVIAIGMDATKKTGFEVSVVRPELCFCHPSTSCWVWYQIICIVFCLVSQKLFF